MVFLTGSSCSKTDTSRTSEENQTGQSQVNTSNGDSIIQPANIAGAFLTFQIDGGSYTENSKILVGFRVVDSNGRSVMNTLMRAATRITWQIAADGNELPIQVREQGASLTSVVAYDVIATVGNIGAAWPVIRPKLSFTLKDGGVRSIDTITNNAKARLSKAPAQPSGSEPPATDDLPPGFQYLFPTTDSYEQPGILRFRANDHDKLRGCLAWLKVKDSLPQSDLEASSIIANTVCQCEAALSTLSSVKARAAAFQAILYTDNSSSAFSARMQALQQRNLIDTARQPLGEPGGRIFFYSENGNGQPKLDVNFPNAVVRDVNGADIALREGMYTHVWTGIPDIVDIGSTSSATGYPNCGGWLRYSTDAYATGGTVGAPDASAFVSYSAALYLCSSTLLKYYCMEPGK